MALAANLALGLRFEAALAYAARVHAAQTRKGGPVPYIAHLLAVTSIVVEDAAEADALDEDEVVAALLHDAAEDHGGEERLDDIRAHFGERVADMVRALSDSLVSDGEKPPWRDRKEAYLRGLEEERDPGVLRVSLADKLYNARAILRDYRLHGETIWRGFNPDADPLWYYGALAALFARRAPGPLSDELAETVWQLERMVAGAPPPLPGARWVRRGRLLAGPHPGAAGEGEARRNLAALRGAGVEEIIDLTGDDEGLPSYDHLLDGDLIRRGHPTPSGGAPAPERMEPILDAIDAALERGEGVYLHCRGGGGRTEAVVRAYLARRQQD